MKPAWNMQAALNLFHINLTVGTSPPFILLSKLHHHDIFPASLVLTQILKLTAWNSRMPCDLALCTEQPTTIRTLWFNHFRPSHHPLTWQSNHRLKSWFDQSTGFNSLQTSTVKLWRLLISGDKLQLTNDNALTRTISTGNWNGTNWETMTSYNWQMKMVTLKPPRKLPR